MKFHFQADRVLETTASGLEGFVPGLHFNGPGLYILKESTILVVPVDCTSENIWHQRWPEGTYFNAYIYNAPLEDTGFSLRCPVVRRDDRD